MYKRQIDAVNTITDNLKNWVSNAVLIKDMDTFTNAMRTTALRIQHAALQFISAAADTVDGRTNPSILPPQLLSDLQQSILHKHSIAISTQLSDIQTQVVLRDGQYFIIHDIQTTDTKREAELYHLLPLPTYLPNNITLHLSLIHI